jgi:hypothetical protein
LRSSTDGVAVETALAESQMTQQLGQMLVDVLDFDD